MELKVLQEPFSTVGKQWEGKNELPIDTEILIPDYLPPIFKIVKCLFYLVVLQKNISGKRLRIEGYLRCLVFYQGDSGQGLCQSEQKLPFERTVELPDDSYVNGRVWIYGNVEYLNCRSVNQRRIEVRGGYNLCYKIKGKKECNVVVWVEEKDMPQNLKSISCMQNVMALDKLMTSEEEVHLPENLGNILDISGSGEIQEQKLLGDKAVFKGVSSIQITYTLPGTEQLMSETVKVPFNQIVELELLGEKSMCFAQIETIGCALLGGGRDESTVTVTSMLHISVYEKEDRQLVQDTFSTSHETNAAYQNILYEQQESVIDTVVSMEGNIPFPEEDVRYIGCLADCGALYMSDCDDGSVVGGMATVHLIYSNNLGEYLCIDKEMPFTTDKCCKHKADRYALEGSAQIVAVQVRQSNTGFAVEVQVRVQGLLLGCKGIQILSGVSLGEPLPDTGEIALRICYAKAGEALFEIAKRYHASPELLRECNQLDGETLESFSHILIPIGK